MPGHKFINSIEKCFRSRYPAESKISMQCFEIHVSLNLWAQKQRLYFRSKKQPVTNRRIVEWFDAQPVPRQQQFGTCLRLPQIKQGQGEHTIQFIQYVHSPFLVSVNYDFRICGRPEPVTTSL